MASDKPADDIITAKVFADPEIKRSRAGNDFANIRLAKSDKKKDGDGYTPTIWIRGTAFKNAVDDIRDHRVTKGSIVRCHGKLQQGEDYKDKTTGETKKGGLEMVIFKIEPVERRARQASESFDDAEPAPRRSSAPATEPKRDAPPIDDMDCPF